MLSYFLKCHLSTQKGKKTQLPPPFFLVISAHSLTFLCALFSGSGDFTRIFLSKRDRACSPPFFTQARHINWENIRRRVGFTLRAFHLYIPLSLSPLYTSLSLSIPLYSSLPLSIPLSLSLSPSLSLSLLSLPPSLYLSFYLAFSHFPSLSLLSIILFDVSNGRFRPCFLD